VESFTWIGDKLDYAGSGSDPLVMGPGWLLEITRVDRGSYSFLRDGVTVQSETPTFGEFYAAFGIVEFCVTNIKGEFVGLSRPGKPPASWLTEPMMFELGNLKLPRSPEALIALVQKPRPFLRIETKSNPSKLAWNARRRIADTYRDDVSIADIAHELGVSHAHLTRQFKRDYGFTPVSYRYRLRVSEAIGRLSSGESVLDVGYEVGFNDTGRFYQDFRKVTRTSPGKCRP